MNGATVSPLHRRRLLESGTGTRLEAFGPAEWGILATVACLWGSSFLFIEIVLGAVVLGEHISSTAIVGTALVLLGAVLASRRETPPHPRVSCSCARCVEPWCTA
ncbi:MAG: hypothetical protein ACRDQD_25470 [Nocardioidaceae bacterium]